MLTTKRRYHSLIELFLIILAQASDISGVSRESILSRVLTDGTPVIGENRVKNMETFPAPSQRVL